MKKSDLSDYPKVESRYLSGIFKSECPVNSGFLTVGDIYRFYPHVVWAIIPETGRRWQAAVLIRERDKESFLISPLLLCGVGYVDNTPKKVNPDSLKGDLIKLIMQEVKVRCNGYIECIVDEYSENGISQRKISKKYPLIELI